MATWGDCVLIEGASVEKVDSTKYILHVASVKVDEGTSHSIQVGDKECTLVIKYGDHSKALSNAVDSLKQVSIFVMLIPPSSTDFYTRRQRNTSLTLTRLQCSTDTSNRVFNCIVRISVLVLILFKGLHRVALRRTRRVQVLGLKMSVLSLKATLASLKRTLIRTVVVRNGKVCFSIFPRSLGFAHIW